MEDQALKWWHVRWGLAGRILSRFAIVTGKIVGGLCLVAALFYGAFYLLEPWITSRSLSRSDPRLSLIPASLPDMAEVPLSNLTVDCYGFRFRLPKEGIVHAAGEGATMVRLPNGGVWINNTLRDAKDWTFLSVVNDDKRAKALLGNETLRSSFTLMQASMEMTPEQVKWWRFRSSQNERAELLLSTKFFAITSSFTSHSFTIGPIYKVSVDGFRGFQLGNPDVPPYESHVDLFDATDRHFGFDVTGPEGHGQVLTQKEINAMVGSIRPVSDR